MSILKKPLQIARSLLKQMRKLSEVTVKAFVNSVLRTLLKIGKRPNLAKAGFALPTVMMVTLVVVLLTSTLVLRSFDRNRNAINARSEQVIQNSSTPAIDRAKAKIEALLADPNLPRGTPPDIKLFDVMKDARYTFGDETRLKLALDFANGNDNTPNGTIDPNPSDPKFEETITTAWKYPVDLDGNGKFDAFTLYGLYWRSPNFVNDNGTQRFARGRNGLEARSIPQETAGLSQVCRSQGQTAATTVGDSDWYKQGGNLSKAFYAYAATVPITDLGNTSFGSFPASQFEVNKNKNKAFSGLEYEQDRYRSGLNNNSVWYQNDLVLNPGSTFRLNGRVFTNANLLLGGKPSGGPGDTGGVVEFFQVSSAESCFYQQENAQINVGAQVGTGDLSKNGDQQPGQVHLFKGYGNSPLAATVPEISGTTRSTTSAGGSEIAFNDAAYNQRISLMRQTALSFCSSGCNDATTILGIPQYTDDPDLKKSLEDALNDDFASKGLTPLDVLQEQVELYLRNRTRGVPYAEIPSPDGEGAKGSFDTDGDNIDPGVFASGIEPPEDWREPLTPDESTLRDTTINLITNNLPQSNPSILGNDKIERELGDRVNVGNNLPALWKDTDGKYKGQNAEKRPYANGTNWTQGGGTRYRTTQAQALQNIGVAERGGFWELAAALDPSAQPPAPSNTGGGGLRIITGAGIYVDGNVNELGVQFPRQSPSQTAPNPTRSSFLPAPSWDTKFVDPTGADAARLDPLGNANTNNDIPKFNNAAHILVWSDLMPMTDGTRALKGDLLMRATAVYHYVEGSKANPNIRQTPIACVSSYYDPTDATTARNQSFLPDVSGGIDTTGDGIIDNSFGGNNVPLIGPFRKSNNGVVYDFPGRAIAGYQAILARQASLVFPNGRLVNEPLRKALTKFNTSNFTDFTLADYSAIDTAICAIRILNAPRAFNSNPPIPHGAIKEASFIDSREVKAIDSRQLNDPDYKLETNFDLPLEQRQPLEVRVTDINLKLLAETAHGTFDADADGIQEEEYLLPNSGIIYASRDDALSDNSNIYVKKDATTVEVNLNQADDVLSSTDFRLDPTRRPNGIRIHHGLRLARGAGAENRNISQEKGLILVTNLPAYVQGHTNLHLESGTASYTAGGAEEEEFNTALTSNWGNFYTRTENDLNLKFACRNGQTKCTSPGDQWRPATIISDAITLQSTEYQDGYRSQGDFDLRNNGGNVLAGDLADKGFFENSFVTSTKWSATNNYPDPTSSQVSYLLNGVTPIQRRANRVVAYPTEFCRKIPVSLCEPTDWTANPPNIDTSKSVPNPINQRYARRVRFQREDNKYYYDTDGFPRLRGQPVPNADNALWFVTRQETAPGIFGPSFDGGNTPATRQPFIFHAPELPDLGPLRGYAAVDPAIAVPLSTALSPITRTDYDTGSLPLAPVTTQLAQVFGQFTNTDTDPKANPFADVKITRIPGPAGTLDINAVSSSKKTSLTGGGEMVVYQRDGNFTLTPTNKLTLTGDASSVFVFRIKGNLVVEQGSLVLGNVLPENVYWIVDNNFTIRITPSTDPNVVSFAGNVLSKGRIRLNANALGTRLAILEGRAFSTAGLVQIRGNANGSASILPPRGNHPRLVPVTQIQSPSGAPGPGTFANSTGNPLIGNQEDYSTYWLQKAKATNYNIASVVGDSPNRPDEQSGGLNNLVRLQENWGRIGGNPGQTLTIKGSFIQQKRSTRATAPFASIRLGPTGSTPDTTLTGASGLLSLFNSIFPNNRYQTSNGTPNGSLPYYNAPGARQWGFDVGLLSQRPDLFSQKFTTDISKSQSYYRQVGRGDDWIKTLLCAAEPASPSPTSDERTGQPGTTYNKYVVSDTERPDCRSVTNVNLPYPPNS